MSSFPLPSPALAAPSSIHPVVGASSGELDDFALGCECADPALQIAMWGQESGEPVQAPGSSAV